MLDIIAFIYYKLNYIYFPLITLNQLIKLIKQTAKIIGAVLTRKGLIGTSVGIGLGIVVGVCVVFGALKYGITINA